MDTVAVAWRSQGGTELASALMHAESFQQPRGIVLATPDDTGARVAFYPESGLVRVECRAAALLDGTPDSHRLASADELAEVPEAAEAALARLTGAGPSGTDAECRRLDLAVERRFDQAADGLDFIRAVALLTPGARYKRKLFLAEDGRIETGYVTTKRGGLLSRIYDKGVESGTEAPGHLVRLEAQNRIPKSKAQTLSTLATSDLRPLAARTWAVYAEQQKETVVTNFPGAVDTLAERVARGSISVARAERLAGSLAFLDRFGRAIYDTRQGQRRLAALRDAGIVVDEHLAADRTLPVGELLLELLDTVSVGG